MRTYAGHSTARASNELFKRNLAKGQTGLSVAFDLPTQTGYDADDPMARGEVGKVGVPVSHLGDMETLFADIPLAHMNTSMTINATAPWLLALYVAVADVRGLNPATLAGTTQNDIIKEYLSRGTYMLPPAASMRLTTDLIVHTVHHMPKWNPINICSYHLQEAGATPVQELAYALVTAMAVLDAVKARGDVDPATFSRVVGRISFFVNAGIRFVEEMCKLRAFVDLWDRVTRLRYGVADAKHRRFRYGIQVNSLGLTEQQPENNIVRIVLEMLAVTLSKQARARAVQLPAWNEALGLPTPWDQQWSLRAQQILAFETDLLEYDDLFDQNPVVERTVRDLSEGAWQEVQQVLSQGGALEAVQSGYIKQQLVRSNARRLRRIESGQQVVVGVNRFEQSEPSPLNPEGRGLILTVDPKVEQDQRQNIERWRLQRNAQAHRQALEQLRRAAQSTDNLLPHSIRAARSGVTTGEWGNLMRELFGDYRAPTGIGGGAGPSRPPPNQHTPGEATEHLRERLQNLSRLLGRRPKMVVGKPGLDGHSNGAEQIAIKARDVGFDVVYDGIRTTPQRLAITVVEEGAHLLGLSILSGSHMDLVKDVMHHLGTLEHTHVPVVVGGIIPETDAAQLTALGVRRIFTPKSFRLQDIMAELVSLLEQQQIDPSLPPSP